MRLTSALPPALLYSAPNQEEEASSQAAPAEKGRGSRQSLLESGRGARKTSRPGTLPKQHHDESPQMEGRRAEVSDSETEPSEDDEDRSERFIMHRHLARCDSCPVLTR